jgi:chromosome segregation ATPase
MTEPSTPPVVDLKAELTLANDRAEKMALALVEKDQTITMLSTRISDISEMANARQRQLEELKKAFEKLPGDLASTNGSLKAENKGLRDRNKLLEDEIGLARITVGNLQNKVAFLEDREKLFHGNFEILEKRMKKAEVEAVETERRIERILKDLTETVTTAVGKERAQIIAYLDGVAGSLFKHGTTESVVKSALWKEIADKLNKGSDRREG